MQLYTVVMNSKVLKTRYEGRKAIIEETFVEQRYADLPYKTAQAYKEKWPDQCVGIFQQIMPVSARDRIKVRVGESNKESRRVLDVKKTAVAEPKNKPPARKPARDYSDLVNTMVEAS